MDKKNAKNLCQKLIKAENEKEVIRVLKKAKLWDDTEYWTYYGNTENNYAIIGNQQSSADSALVEKIINSVDAVLMRECLVRRINPSSNEAPKTLNDALKQFFNITNGNIANLSKGSRKELANNIYLVITGNIQKPNIIIIDKGEGQTPEKFPETFLSLNQSNKLRIPFVQGKFNMGSTGVLQFCGEHNVQLILSKRHPEIAKGEKDSLKQNWGFTIVRRVDPEDNMKHSSYKYLINQGTVFNFDAEELLILPENEGGAYSRPLKWGTFIKLYDYQLPSGIRSQARTHLWARLSALLPNIGLPLWIYERRKYEGSQYPRLLNGLSVELDHDKQEIFEKGFPSSIFLNFKGNEIPVKIYAFKPSKKKDYYINKEGVLFTVNGQSHGFLHKKFFERKSVGLAYLADSLIVIADCSKIDRRYQEKLFMNSRDRLRDGELKRELEKILTEELANHKGLKELKNRRRQQELQNRYKNKESLKQTLEKIAKRSSVLSSLLITGKQITNPFNLKNVGTQNDFEGKEYPTYFVIKKKYDKEKPKQVNKTSFFRVQFETDAENNYLTRENNPGEFKLEISSNQLINYDYRINLWNGIATLNVYLNNEVEVGEIIEFTAIINDIMRVNPFKESFFVKILPMKKSNNRKNGERINPPNDTKGGKRKKPSELKLPEIVEVYQKDWLKYNFDQFSVMKVIEDPDEGFDFYINMDNTYLLEEIKINSQLEPKLIKEKYITINILIGLGLLAENRKNKKQNSINIENHEEANVFNKISLITKSIIPMVLPLLIHNE